MCDLHMHMGRYDRAEVVLTLLLDQSDFKDAVESQIQKVNKSICSQTAASVAVSSFELNQRVLLLHLGIRT